MENTNTRLFVRRILKQIQEDLNSAIQAQKKATILVQTEKLKLADTDIKAIKQQLSTPNLNPEEKSRLKDRESDLEQQIIDLKKNVSASKIMTPV